jgi:hypothetical protein
MRFFVKTLALVTVVAVATGLISYRLNSETALQAALGQRDALAWLRTDFQLNETQFARVRALHASYSNVCEQHCRAIQEAAHTRNALRDSGGGNAAALASAEKRLQDLRQICETAIAVHVREVAAQMSPESGQRYLALVLPRISNFDHRAAPDLQITSHRHP